MKFVFLFLTFALCFPSKAMRIPSGLSRGSFTFDDGFSLDTTSTDWTRTNPDKNSKEKIEAMFFKSSATFTVRVDKDTQYKNLTDYANKWLKSYGQFGLEVLGHQYFKNETAEKGLVVDLTNSSTHKKMRQVIFFRNSRAVVMTCADQTYRFEDTIKDCNKLIRSFGWIEEIPKSTEPLSKPQS